MEQDPSRTTFLMVSPVEYLNKPANSVAEFILRLLIVCPRPSNTPWKYLDVLYPIGSTTPERERSDSRYTVVPK